MSDAPTWYDLLDVPRDASAEEVRAAWRTQIADLEPGDRRFDALNRAAKVLLDPPARHVEEVVPGGCVAHGVLPSVVPVPVAGSPESCGALTGVKSSTSHSPSIRTRSTVKRNGSGSWSTVRALSPVPWV